MILLIIINNDANYRSIVLYYGTASRRCLEVYDISSVG